MAGSVYGADVVELRSLSERMTRSADDLDRSANLLTHQIVATTAWVGPSAQAFRGEWSGSHRGAVAASARALRECSAALRRNADEQERTSAADSSWVGALGGGSTSGVAGIAVDERSIEWIRSTVLPDLEKTYDMLTTLDGHLGLIKYLKNPVVDSKIPFLSTVMSVHDLVAAAPETWDDIQSGNIWRFGKAIFRTGWTIAKMRPDVGLVETVANVGVDAGKMIMDGIMGPGTSDRAFNDVGLQIDKAGNDLNSAGVAAGGWLADRIKENFKSVFHF